MLVNIIITIITLCGARLGSARPNIVIFLADDLGFADLSYTGHPTSYSPNIDKLAKNGKFFTEFYSASSICSPSR